MKKETTKKYYANTKKQPLGQHLFAVGYLAQLMSKQLIDDDKLTKSVFIAGCWHDMGKIDPGFQTWLAKELKKEGVVDIAVPDGGQHNDKRSKSYPRHNEVSLLLFHLSSQQDFDNKNSRKNVEHAIYWHHDKWFRGVDKNGRPKSFSLDMIFSKLKQKLGIEGVEKILEATRKITLEISSIAANYADDTDLLINLASSVLTDEKLSKIEDAQLPIYKEYAEKLNSNDYRGNINENAKNNLARTLIVSADRIISSLSAQRLDQLIQDSALSSLLIDSTKSPESDSRSLASNIEACLTGFDEKYTGSDRNKRQADAAYKLSDSNISVGVLDGPAGCGKTKIALEWAKNTHAKKIIWICPRVQICQGLFDDLTSAEYLPNANIEICTGQLKFTNSYADKTPDGMEFSGDIVLTTIDQVINTISTHSKVTGLLQYMNAHVVFDEYHEYILMPAFNLLFAELVACKKMKKSSSALLVSATPNPYFVEQLLGIDENDIIGIKSFNKSQYEIKFTPFKEGAVEGNPLYDTQPKNTIVISNAAITAQKSFIKNQASEKALLFHSKFKKTDKQLLFLKVLECFGRNGSRAVDIIRSGPILQASANITSSKIVSEFTFAENHLQRLGRLGRFGENTGVSTYIVAIPESLLAGNKEGPCARFLKSANSLRSAIAWHKFLTVRLADQSIFSVSELYQIYKDFNADPVSRKAIESDLVAALERSVEMIDSKLLDPVTPAIKSKEKEDGLVTIKKNSLRGNSRFVQMAVMNIGNDEERFPDEYAYDEHMSKETLTFPVHIIRGNKSSSRDLLAFMVKRHHRIKTSASKAYNDSVLLGLSRNPDSPIYLSYTPEDLAQAGTKEHPHAIYYAMGKNQPIGAISAHQLNK